MRAPVSKRNLSTIDAKPAFEISMLSRSVTVRTDRARRELGWAPVVTVEEGLRQLQQ